MNALWETASLLLKGFSIKLLNQKKFLGHSLVYEEQNKYMKMRLAHISCLIKAITKNNFGAIPKLEKFGLMAVDWHIMFQIYP